MLTDIFTLSRKPCEKAVIQCFLQLDPEFGAKLRLSRGFHTPKPVFLPKCHTCYLFRFEVLCRHEAMKPSKFLLQGTRNAVFMCLSFSVCGISKPEEISSLWLCTDPLTLLGVCTCWPGIVIGGSGCENTLSSQAATVAQPSMGSSQSFFHLRWNLHHPLPVLSPLDNIPYCPLKQMPVVWPEVYLFGCWCVFICKHSVCAVCKQVHTVLDFILWSSKELLDFQNLK